MSAWIIKTVFGNNIIVFLGLLLISNIKTGLFHKLNWHILAAVFLCNAFNTAIYINNGVSFVKYTLATVNYKIWVMRSS